MFNNLSPLELLLGATTFIETLVVLYLAFRKSPYERKTLAADAEAEFANAESKRFDTDHRRLELYDETLNKLLERDRTLVHLNQEIATLKADNASFDSRLKTALHELEAERTLRLAAEKQVLTLTSRVTELEQRLATLTPKGT